MESRRRFGVMMVEEVGIKEDIIKIYVPLFSNSSDDIVGKRYKGSYSAFIGRYNICLVAGNILESGGFLLHRNNNTNNEESLIEPGYSHNQIEILKQKGKKILSERNIFGPRGGIKGKVARRLEQKWRIVLIEPIN